MSISGIGAQASGYASQMLASLLSQLSSTSSATDSSTATASTASSNDAPPPPPGANALTGSSKPSLAGQVLMTLMRLQDDSSGSSTSSTDTQGSDPLQNLVSAMDSDGDGTVSQTEMESYIQNAGGTTDEADQLYTLLGGSSDSSGSSGGLTKDQFASALPPPPPGGHGHHGPRAGDTGDSSGADALVKALDSDGDGSVSKSEFESFVTANGGTTDQADSDFAALDTSNAGSLTATDFATAWENLQNNTSSSNTMVVSLLDAFAGANKAVSTTSVSA